MAHITKPDLRNLCHNSELKIHILHCLLVICVADLTGPLSENGRIVTVTEDTTVTEPFLWVIGKGR